jgi:hypothetical protein
MFSLRLQMRLELLDGELSPVVKSELAKTIVGVLENIWPELQPERVQLLIPCLTRNQVNLDSSFLW